MKKIFLLLFIWFLNEKISFGQTGTINDTGTLRTRINADIVPNTSGAISAYRLNNILNGILNVMGVLGADTISNAPLYFPYGFIDNPTYDGLVARSAKPDTNYFALKSDLKDLATVDTTLTIYSVDTISAYPKCTAVNGQSYLVSASPPAKYWCGGPDSVVNPFYTKKNQVAVLTGGVFNYTNPAIGAHLDVTNKKTSGSYKYYPDSVWKSLLTIMINGGNSEKYSPKVGSKNNKPLLVITKGNVVFEFGTDSSVTAYGLRNTTGKPVHLTTDANGKISMVIDTALTAIDPVKIDSLGKIYLRQSFIDSIRNGNFGGGGGAAAWGSISGTLSSQSDLQAALNAKVTGNTAITGATKTKITYDSKGLVTSGANLAAGDIPDLSATYEVITNKATGTSLGTSNSLYPSQNAVKVYVDNGLSTKLNISDTAAINGQIVQIRSQQAKNTDSITAHNTRILNEATARYNGNIASVAVTGTTTKTITLTKNDASTVTTTFTDATGGGGAAYGDSAYTKSSTGTIVYNKTSFANTNDFTNVGVTTRIVNNAIRDSAGANDTSQYLILKNYQNADENNDKEILFKVITLGGGVGVAAKSANTWMPATLAGRINFFTNVLTLYDNNGNVITQYTLSITIAANDLCRLTYSQRGMAAEVVFTDITQNNYTASVAGSDKIGSASNISIPNSNNLAIYNYGGVYDILNVKLISYSYIRPYVLFIGDSKAFGGTSLAIKNRFANLSNLGIISVGAGTSDRTVEQVNDTAYYINIIKPSIVILCGLGRNDSASSVASATWRANYQAIVSAFTNRGITVVHMLPIPEGTTSGGLGTQTTIKNFITTTYPSAPTFDPSTGWINSLFVSSDSIHPNSEGHRFIANALYNSGVIVPKTETIITNYDPEISPQWTGLHNFNSDNIGITPLSKILLSNYKQAVSGSQQYSPAIESIAQGWGVNTNIFSRSVTFQQYAAAVQGTTNPTGYYSFDGSVFGTYTRNLLTIGSGGSIGVNTAIANVGDNGSTFTAKGESSNGYGIISAYRNNNTAAAGTGFQTILNNSASNPITYSYFNGYIITNTAGSESGGLSFFTRNAGTLTQQINIDNNGKFGIGLTAPSDYIHIQKSVNGGIRGLCENTSSGGNAQADWRTKNNSGDLTQITTYGSGFSGYGAIAARAGVLYSTSPAGLNLFMDANAPIIFSTGSGSPATERMRITGTGNITFPATNTATGTTGAQTINKPSGKVNFAASASTLVVTNSLVSTSSIVMITVEGTDATATSARVTLSSGSFTITLNAAATAETKVSFLVIN